MARGRAVITESSRYPFKVSRASGIATYLCQCCGHKVVAVRPLTGGLARAKMIEHVNGHRGWPPPWGTKEPLT